jgi:hypothetical protein
MKTMNRILFTSTLAAALSLLSQTKAQAQTTDDGIAASPKVRVMLNERKASASITAAPSAAVQTLATAQRDNLAASPKLRQMLDERKTVSGVASAPATVVASTAGNGRDIAASPKLREQMKERTVQFQIAPLK